MSNDKGYRCFGCNLTNFLACVVMITLCLWACLVGPTSSVKVAFLAKAEASWHCKAMQKERNVMHLKSLCIFPSFSRFSHPLSNLNKN